MKRRGARGATMRNPLRIGDRGKSRSMAELMVWKTMLEMMQIDARPRRPSVASSTPERQTAMYTLLGKTTGRER